MNKHFNFYYEIGFHRPMDFVFKFKGGLKEKEFEDKTKLIKSYPSHLKYTLFQNDPKLQDLRSKDFAVVFFAYDEIKEKGNKLYRKKNYRESINYYFHVNNI